MSDAHDRVVQLASEFLRRVWGPEHGLAAIDELMTEDYVITSGGLVIRGREAFKAGFSSFRNSCWKQERKA